MTPSDRSRIVTMINIALNLRRLRREKDLDRNELCEKAHVAPSYYGELEVGDKAATYAVLHRLAQALDIDPTDIVSNRLDSTIEALIDFMEPGILKIDTKRKAATQGKKKTFPIVKEVINLLDSAPGLAKAFSKTVTNIAREHDVGRKKEVFLPILLRTYQEENCNHFSDIEDAADRFLYDNKLDKKLPITYEELKSKLEDKYEYTVLERPFGEEESDYVHLPVVRSVWHRNGGRNILIINNKLSNPQRAFEAGKEIGYNLYTVVNNIKEARELREQNFSLTEINSFPQLLNNFRASYFAGALLMPLASLEKRMDDFFKKKRFEPMLLNKIMADHDVIPEMFLHRLSQILPGKKFGLKRLHLLRFQTVIEEDKYRQAFDLTKYFNLASLPFRYAESSSEKYCRLYGAIQIFKEFVQQGDKSHYIKAQRSRFYKETGYSDQTYLCITIARRSTIQRKILYSVSLGFPIDEKFRKTVAFWNDRENIESGNDESNRQVKAVSVGHTCQRCHRTWEECPERAAPPTIYDDVQRREEAKHLRMQVIETIKSSVS